MTLILYRSCPACGNFAGYAGTFGNLAHYNCQHCGIWFNANVEYDDAEELYDMEADDDKEV